MSDLTKITQILQGTDELIDKQLGNHKQGTIGMRLDKAPQNFSTRKLLEDMISKIENNLEKSWKSSRQQSPEVVLGKSAEN